MLPSDVSLYVTMHMSSYPTFNGLRKFIRDYVKVVTHQLAMKSQTPLLLWGKLGMMDVLSWIVAMKMMGVRDLRSIQIMINKTFWPSCDRRVSANRSSTEMIIEGHSLALGEEIEVDKRKRQGQ